MYGQNIEFLSDKSGSLCNNYRSLKFRVCCGVLLISGSQTDRQAKKNSILRGTLNNTAFIEVTRNSSIYFFIRFPAFRIFLNSSQASDPQAYCGMSEHQN
jgi:hypothetical protein